MKRPPRCPAPAVALCLLAGCITVNINFPAHEVEEAAEVIVEEARPEGDMEAGGETPPADGGPKVEEGEGAAKGDSAPAPASDRRAGASGRGGTPHLVAFPASPPAAQEAKEEDRKKDPPESDIRINIDTPVIKAIRASLKKRYPKLLPHYEKGVIGENREGYLEIRDDKSLGVAGKRDLWALMEEENRDRRNLYQEIVKANRFGSERLRDVGRIFAREWIEKSRTGWWVQDEKGKWVRKPPPKEKEKEKSEKKASAAA